jgi:ABC-2 type transport system permease protein
MTSTGDAQIVERGFQPYDGPRSGVPGAVRSVTWQSVKAALGLGRPARHKIFPFLAVFIAYVPAIVFVGVVVLFPVDLDPADFADYPDTYGNITLAIILFAAFVGPEVLIPDRRNGMLALYLSTPLDRRTYLAAKGIAASLILGLVTLGPPLLLLIGYTAESVGPDGLDGWLTVFLRILVSAIAVSAPLAAISMAASSLTDRKAFAVIGVVLTIFGLSGLSAALVEGADWSRNVYLIDPLSMSLELVYRIFGSDNSEFSDLSTAAVLGSNIAWTVGGLAVVAWRYSRLVIAR